jgi:hypothetical protein
MTEIENGVNEARLKEAQRIVRVAALRGSPVDGDRCGDCYYYLEPGADLAFCWHEKLQILVGTDWWCHYFEMRHGD